MPAAPRTAKHENVVHRRAGAVVEFCDFLYRVGLVHVAFAKFARLQIRRPSIQKRSDAGSEIHFAGAGAIEAGQRGIRISDAVVSQLHIEGAFHCFNDLRSAHPNSAFCTT